MPATVQFENFHLYNKFHTKKILMWSGNTVTALFPIKESEQFYCSIESWSSLCSTFKKKKPFQLQFEIPIVENQKSIDFLEKNCWKDWIQKQKNDSDTIEAVALLKKLFPDKELFYFYELDDLIGTYAFGTFGRGKEKLTDFDIERQKYYNAKYNKIPPTPEIKAKLEEAKNASEKEQESLFEEFHNLNREHRFNNNNLIDTFIDVCKNSVVYPVAFSKNTAEWSREKYDKLVGYAHAGEIVFITHLIKYFLK